MLVEQLLGEPSGPAPELEDYRTRLPAHAGVQALLVRSRAGLELGARS